MSNSGTPASDDAPPPTSVRAQPKTTPNSNPEIFGYNEPVGRVYGRARGRGGGPRRGGPRPSTGNADAFPPNSHLPPGPRLEPGPLAREFSFPVSVRGAAQGPGNVTCGGRYSAGALQPGPWGESLRRVRPHGTLLLFSTLRCCRPPADQRWLLSPCAERPVAPRCGRSPVATNRAGSPVPRLSAPSIKTHLWLAVARITTP